MSLDAYFWMGPETPNRFISAVLIGFVAFTSWAMFGAGVHQMLD